MVVFLMDQRMVEVLHCKGSWRKKVRWLPDLRFLTTAPDQPFLQLLTDRRGSHQPRNRPKTNEKGEEDPNSHDARADVAVLEDH